MLRDFRQFVIGMTIFCATLVMGFGATEAVKSIKSTPSVSVQQVQEIDNDFELMPDGRTIVLSGEVSSRTYGSFVRATTQALLQRSNNNNFTIILQTPGGDGSATVAMMNHIKMLQQEHGFRFTMIVTGGAHSAGSYLFMMGDERIIYRGGTLMWHTIFGQLNARDLWTRINDEQREYIQLLDNFVVNTFKELFPYITDEWIDETFWNTDMTWMTAEEALKLGIATRILG